MLKALELVGFKSFADKTRFDFPAGITVVVGPNGSGKSNIVDGIKWVLGEQSAKSLRGKEMADVIFKGAGGTTGGRKAANTAEATLILENEDRQIDYDADEIHVTRRVYRSGEGEYLINGEACRLKDIRDLFRGTGVGTDAYSLIEQGKVDRLLQASPKERRAIFEEAAGISRFKAKKIEAQRRLARVEQNLLRLSDIVEEVGSRYRSVKAQASKASRYREYSERLKLLRTQMGLIEFRRISEQLIEIEEEKTQIAAEVEGANALIDLADREVTEFESSLASSTADTSTSEQRISAFRARIAALESTTHHERTRCRELEQQKSNLQNQLLENRTRIADLRHRLSTALTEQESAELAFAEAVESAGGLELQIAAALEQHAALQVEYDEAKTRRMEQDRMLQSLNGLIQTDEGELKNVNTFLVQQQSQIAEYQSDIAQVREQLELLRQQEQRIAQEAESKDSALAQARGNLEETRRAYEQCNREIAKLKSEHNGVAQRAQVIQELEQRLDGVHAGVKQVLALAAENSQTPFGEVHGLVADLVQVHVQHAPLVDVILGDLSQHVVVAGDALLPALAYPETPLKGRVGFIRLDHLPAPSPALKVDLAGQPGIIGRADQLVRFAEHYRPLMEKLLGDTWVVKTMADALRLQEETSPLIRYTTLDGDLFEKDGTIVVGPRSSSLGLVSRRSELRSLKIQVKELEEQLLQAQAKADALSNSLAGYERESERLMGEHTHLARALSDQRVTTKAASERHDHLTKSLLTVQKEHDGTAQKRAALDASLVEHQSALKLAADAIEQLAGVLGQRKQSIGQLQKASEENSARLNQLKIEIAKNEQQLAGLEDSTRELKTALDERQATGEQLAVELQACEERYITTQRSILDATSQLADIYIQKDQAALQHSQLVESRETLTTDLRKARETLRTQQQHIKKLESRKHDIELSATQIVHSRTTMTERLRDDYGIELATLDIEIDREIESAKETVEEEIVQLRRKINNIGAVNTDALTELEDLESRYTTLDGQYQDLVQAKETLDKIIVRINADSRRLFAETLEAIRQNFQVLYRRTFGGGRADIILEEGVDILDAGIEIVATPPGKPEFNNSLLSGGEKALTAVSLLMAIFQFRPSPFCVLDEVDAPFDEANIGRFVDVLRSFLGWTKFVIVTHSKKTMTAANTLHGVTMEESGVSTRVSVRFDDVSEDGQILSTSNRANADDDKGAA